jgi:cytochrome c
VPDFRYSPALQKLDLVWTAETLDTWLENPSAVAKGTSMGFRVRKPEDRAAIISFLETVTEE